jgi:hypothetical protein
MGFPMVSSKKRGTMRFYGPWPKPSSVKSPLVVGQIFIKKLMNFMDINKLGVRGK